MSKNLNAFERAARLMVGLIMIYLSFAVFVHPVARLLIILGGVWLILEGGFGGCPFYHNLGIKKPGPMRAETALYLVVAGIQSAIGYVWWHAGWVKMSDADFIATLPRFFERCAQDNPHLLMKGFLMESAARNFAFYGGLVQLTQYAIGIGLIVLAYLWLSAKTEQMRRGAWYFTVVALGAGAIMNAVFYFAFSHMDTWVGAANAVMFWVEAALIYGFINLLINKEK
jgi:hypothetical protein